MIQIAVKNCPDSEYEGEYFFDKNLVYVGSNHDADLYLPDEKLSRNHLLIEIVDGQLLAHLGKNAQAFKVEGKLATKFKFLSAGNVIEAGGSSFKIMVFAPTVRTTKREWLNKNTDELIRSGAPLLEAVKELQEDL